MKFIQKIKFVFLLVLILTTGFSFSQNVPQAMNYQAVARNSSGTVMPNRTITLKISILDGSPSGAAQYAETQTITTNTYGMISLLIGQGTAVTGTFNTIPWANGNQWVKIEMDTTTTGNFTPMGTSQLLSVPYAFYASSTGYIPPSVILGVVNTDGTVLSGTGYSVVHSGNGEYQVTFTSPFTASPVVNVSMEDTLGPPNLSGPGYCNTTHTTGTAFGDFITYVSILTTTLHNTTIAAGTPYYTIYPAADSTTATLTAGTAYDLVLRLGTYTNNDVAAWIDFDQNGVFIATEKLGETDNMGATPASTTINFTVPVGAMNGQTRLRIRETDHPTANDMDPCASMTYGESEDYIVTITGGTPYIPVLILSKVFSSISDVSTSGFTVHTLNSSGVPTDQKFHFFAQ